MSPPFFEAKEILAAAHERGHSLDLPYAGAVTPGEAWQLFSRHSAKIVDVRSVAEYEFIGRVPGSVLIPWKHWPSGELNRQFVPDLRQHCATDDIVLFLCRSAQRSHAAAALAMASGYARAFNVLEGFEGNLDTNQQRGRVGGWRLAGLPWIQS
ncbi:MAG: rhodanese-like domain-containing protein [Betaproteobacteria bacterium]|nr:rhodanese-like domain-containing protein [Betaproteobacteria bacterium]